MSYLTLRCEHDLNPPYDPMEGARCGYCEHYETCQQSGYDDDPCEDFEVAERDPEEIDHDRQS